MGFMSKSGKFTIYDTNNQIDFSQIESKLVKFKPIDDEPTTEGSVGFVSFDDYMMPIGSTPMDKGTYYAASIRMDVRKIPGSVFKKFLRVAFDEERAKTQRPAIARSRKLEIKENVRFSLLMKTLPSTTVVDVVFDSVTGRAVLCSGSKTMQNYFIELLEESFKDDPNFKGSNIVKVDVNSLIKSTNVEAGVCFLNWCFYHANNPESGTTIEPGRNVSLHSETSTVSMVDENHYFEEVMKGLANGKGISKASFTVYLDDSPCTVTIASDFIIGIKTPNVTAGMEEGDEPDKPFYDKAYFVFKAIDEIEELVTTSFNDSLQEWPKVYNEIISWAGGE